MGDPGFISGMIGFAIQTVLGQIIDKINIAVRCRKESDALKHLLHRVHSINTEMQEYRKALNAGRINAPPHSPLPSAVNSWLTELNDLLQDASDLAQQCVVPSSYRLLSRYTMSRKITRFISDLEKHVTSTPSIAFLLQLHQDVANRQGLEQIRETIDSLQLKTSALTGTSGDVFPSTPSVAPSTKYIEEPLVVGQDSASIRIEELIASAQLEDVSRIGLIGMGGAGKTLLLKRVFNGNQVQNLFCNDLLLWLTVSQTPSFNALRGDLVKQIALKVNESFNSRDENHVKTWLNESMKKHKFALFLDDVWETSATSLLEELCVPFSPHHNSNIIIFTSRSRRVVLQLGVAASSIIQMQCLTEDDSWRLFSSHAFPHSHGILPQSIDQENARSVCNECGGLPLALKVVGRAMSGITQSNEWEFALQKLQKDVTLSLYGRMRLSFDALADVAGYGISLQLCFLCLAAYPEDNVIYTPNATQYWIGEGLVAGPDPLKIGQRCANFLADRFLIEPLQKDHDGNVLAFRMHDVLHDLANQIAKKEEKCFFQAGRDLREFPGDGCSGHVRISLMCNRLTRVPQTFGAACIRSLLLASNPYLKEIPKEVIESITALRVLDLSATPLRSLPENVGRLKHLICLRLSCVPIKRLPNSIAALRNLQILDLCGSSIRQLPSGIFKLISLKLLDVGGCQHLQYIPYRISLLTSLEYFEADGCPNAWAKRGWKKCIRHLLSINDLGILKQLKSLALTNYGETIRGGMLGNLQQLEFLNLSLTEMESLPNDMTAMSKLKKLCLTCPQLLQIENSFCGFQYLSYISLFNCGMLKQLPALHKLPSLKHLEIVACPSIQKFPEDFGTGGAFPKLEAFSMVELEKLEQLPIVQEGAMSSLKTLTIMKCEALQILPQSYWNLKSVEKIRVYGCSILLTAMEENFIQTETKIQLVRLSATDTEAFKKRFDEMVNGNKYFLYGEFWCNELFQFLQETYNWF